MSINEVVADVKRSHQYPIGLSLLDASLLAAPASGLVLEFGVATGDTINRLASLTERLVYGFDSFQGLPENWTVGNRKGAFSSDGEPPKVRDNVWLVHGWFDDTVERFMSERRELVAFVHVDCDLYSSTRTVLSAVGPYLMDGAVINFNEFWDYPGADQHEARAFAEFLAAGWSYRCLGWAGNGYSQAAFEVARCAPRV